MHVEYDEEEKLGAAFPSLTRIERLYKAVNVEFGGKIRLIANYKQALKELSPTGKAREGSFEVVDVHSKKRVWSYLSTGQHPMQSEGSMKLLLDKMTPFIA